MESYKDVFYANYVQTHTSVLYGEVTLNKIEDKFKIWEHYYGSFFKHSKPQRVLEVGCGDGGFVYWLNKKKNCKAYGIDISVSYIQAGKSLGIENISCENLFDYLEKTIELFDVIIARDVLEHLNKLEVLKFFELASKKLNEKGKVIIQVPNGQGFFVGGIFYGDFTHEQAYTNSSLSQIALNLNFSAVNSFPVRPVPHGFFSIIRSCLWRLKEFQLRFWKLVETGSSKGIFTQNLIAVISK